MLFGLFGMLLAFGMCCCCSDLQSNPWSLSNRNYSVVVVPAVMHEFIRGQPYWMASHVQKMYGIQVFLYQKLNETEPNFISTNQGSEAGVYLRYIVDHYDNFPDVAVFIHGYPEEHQRDWLNITYCVRYDVFICLVNMFISVQYFFFFYYEDHEERTAV